MNEIERKIYKKVFIGFVLSAFSVFLSVAINGFPKINIIGPFQWFNPDRHPMPFIFVISLIVTIITVLLQIEVETRLYAISSIVNGYSFNETITNFIVKNSIINEEVVQKNITISNDDFINVIAESISTGPDKYIVIINILTFVGVVSALINIINIIIRVKARNKRVNKSLLIENISNKNKNK